MAMCISEPLHHDYSRGMEVSKAVFHAAVRQLRVCRSIHNGTAHVFLGPMHVDVPGKQIWSQVLRGIGMGNEDRVPRTRYATLAHCGMDIILRLAAFPRRTNRHKNSICLRKILGSSIHVPN